MSQLSARFASVVAKAGKPAVHLAWVAIEKDPALKSALATNRVMTVHQLGRGGHKDFGAVGFEKGQKTQILIFPKSLRKFAGQRIVGINYDLLADAVQLEPAKQASPWSKADVPPTRPAKEIKVKAPAREPGETRFGAIPGKKTAPAIEDFPLTWETAAKELDQIAREIKGRTGIVARLSNLSARMREKLAPH